MMIGQAEDLETDFIGSQKTIETYFELDGEIPRDRFDWITEDQETESET
jgi:hypothetical protein